jgi:uronate dehydrogenase
MGPRMKLSKVMVVAGTVPASALPSRRLSRRHIVRREQVLALNIDGCYQVFETARLQEVKRFIFASSNHVIGFHRRNSVLETSSARRPDTRYGVSKVFGEALGRLYSDKHGMSVACLRIGTFRTPDRPTELRHLLNWVSNRNKAQLVRKCIENRNYHFLIAYGVSANTRNVRSNSEGGFLGHVPQDNAEAFVSKVLSTSAAERDIAGQFHGGPICELDFTGESERII